MAASDEGVFDDYVLQARIDKEAESIANWQRARDELQLESLADFHRWCGWTGVMILCRIVL